MFTGIVRGIADVVAFEPRAGGGRLVIDVGETAFDFALGASVSVNGACLTVVDRQTGRYAFDLSAETLARTTLGDLRAGDRVNLEPALRAQEEWGGHLVTGHIDGVGVILRTENRGDCMEVEIEPPESLMHFMAVKGSVAIDGVSLTVNAVGARSLTVMLIPYTREQTLAGGYARGQRVNIEVDLLARYVERMLAHFKASG